MLKCSGRLAGSYLLNQRVVPDWWHPYHREDALEHARRVLGSANRRDDLARDAAAALPSSSSSSQITAGMTMMTGTNEDGTTTNSNSNSNGDPSSPPPPSLTLYELNALVATFTSNHDVNELSAALQYLREGLQQPLAPYHYHALFRVFNHGLDRDNAVQLLEVMAQRGETTLESYARAADCVHSLAPRDGLDRVLAIVAAAQAAFGSLVFVEVAGSEGATVAAFGAGPERRVAAEDLDVLPGPSPPAGEEGEMVEGGEGEEEADGGTTTTATAATTSGDSGSGSGVLSCPVLSSLLHHLATSGGSGCDPVAALVAALWIRALGVRLSDWDCVHLMSCLLTRVEEFPRVRALLGAFPSFAPGCVSPIAVLSRLEERGEIPSSSSSSSSSVTPLAAVTAAMRRSLTAAGADMNRPVGVGVINSRAGSLRTTLQHALDHFTGSGSGGVRGGVGVGVRVTNTGGGAGGMGGHLYNPALLYHTVSILHSSLRDNSEAARVLARAAQVEQAIRAERKARDDKDGGGGGGGGGGGDGDVVSGGEPFSIGHHYLMDIGSILPNLSLRTRENIRDPFTHLVQSMAMREREAQLQETLGGGGGGGGGGGVASESAPSPSSPSPSAWQRSAVAMACAATPPLRPAQADLIGVEGYGLAFMRSHEEAAAALERAVGRVDRSSLRLPRETRLAFRQLAQFCADHPLPNPKLTPNGLAERRKWGAYLDARDTALSLFGSAKPARDSMRHLYYHGGQFPALRSPEVIQQDFQDTLRAILPYTHGGAISNTKRSTSMAAGDGVEEEGGGGGGGSGNSDGIIVTDTATTSTSGLVLEDFTRRRTTQPHVRCSPHVVPPHLHDPAVYNPHPHIALRAAPGSLNTTAGSDVNTKDLFAELWRTLMNPAVMGTDPWYLRNSDMYLLLMRCLLHRLDWEAAAHLTAKMTEQSSYTYLMDHELTTVFREIGDPAGCLAFKIATKLFDGRITRDGQTKREKFHQEQFR